MTEIPYFPPQFDPKEYPTPSGGWSTEVQEVRNALIAPSNGRGMRQECGVFDSDRAFVDSAVLYRAGPGPLMLEPKTLPDGNEHLPGTWMWGGILLNHFGHFLTETLSRIWAYPELADKVDGILFLHKRNGVVNAFHQTFFKLCQVNKPLKVVHAPTSVERLLVPGQGLGLGNIAYGTAKHHDFFQSRFALDIAPDGPDRLYISRSALPSAKGGAIGETMLEENLSHAGYEIFHPQQHSLEVQIARYRAARKIIGLDGSALHLAGLCIGPEPDVAIIWRRSSSAAIHIVNQLHGATGKKPAMIEEIEYDWIVAERGKADRFSIGQIDVPAIGGALAGYGFLDEDPEWDSIDPNLIETQIGKISADTKNEYIPKLSRTRLREMRLQRRAKRAASGMNVYTGTDT
ncbi:glycosyltransferase family 61 protein [Ruegeria arenilitoris]|uniref:glycosyltransferase family 61 protein n=1 Tax=Ruegeria arenilitoris TaxID=1173585 RepID=UPI0014818C4F|nr:glycosyltransferase 61 family protein [Ruegeria arenilitoris]